MGPLSRYAESFVRAAIGAVVARAVGVKIECVFAQFESALLGDGVLPFFDFCVEELLDLATLHAHKVVVVATLVEFEHGLARLKVVALEQARLLELSQHPIHGGQSDVHAIVHQRTVNVFRGQMPLVRALKEIENLQAGVSRLQSDVLQVF